MISVIMPTYNRAHLLPKTIQSVLEQTYHDIEFLIIDDGSDDNTSDLISEFNDKRIIYIQQEHTGYIGRLRNIGLHRSKGEYIALLDSDDIWEKEKLMQQIEILTSFPKAGFCISDVNVINTANVKNNPSYNTSAEAVSVNIFQQLKENNFWVYPSTKLFKRSCLNSTGFFDESIRSSDFNFTIRLSYYFDAVIIYKPLVTRLVHSENRSTKYAIENYSDYLTTFESLLLNKMITKADYKFARWNAFYKVAGLYKEKERFNDARIAYIKALRLKPFHLKSYKHLLFSYFQS